MNSNFHPTRWTLVQESRGDSAAAKRALSELCEIYYQPIRAFVFHQLANQQEADDLTHAFFEQLLEKNSIQNADTTQGKFRNYLLGCVKNFMHRQLDKSTCQKRGSGVTPVDIDDAHLPINDDHAHDEFDRKWAEAVIANALASLKTQMTADGKQLQFQYLQPWLDGGTAGSIETTARNLSMSPNALKVAIHRIRKRFRALVRDEIAATLPNESNVTEELDYLIRVLSKRV